MFGSPIEIESLKIVTKVLWRCPICSRAKTLDLKHDYATGSATIICIGCQSMWGEISVTHMTLFIGPGVPGVSAPNLINRSISIRDWAAMSLSNIELSLLHHSVFAEGVYLGAECSLYMMRSQESGSVKEGETLVIEQIDYGRIFLTAERLIFQGSQRMVEEPLRWIKGAAAIDPEFIGVYSSNILYIFYFDRSGNESVYMWRDLINHFSSYRSL